jgi:hypothetical protein
MSKRLCPACGLQCAGRDASCPGCGATLPPKTSSEAYFSLSGLGLFDLIPGVQELPYPARLILMIVTITAIIVLPRLILNLFR